MEYQRQNKALPIPCQLFSEHQRVHAIRVIPRPGTDHAVPVPFVEGEGGGVVDRRFQADGAASCGLQLFFGRLQ